MNINPFVHVTPFGLRYSLSPKPLKSSMPWRVEVVVRGQVPLTGIVWLFLESYAERKAVFTRIDVRKREREGVLSRTVSTQKYVSSGIIQRLREGRDLT